LTEKKRVPQSEQGKALSLRKKFKWGEKPAKKPWTTQMCWGHPRRTSSEKLKGKGYEFLLLKSMGSLSPIQPRGVLRRRTEGGSFHNRGAAPRHGGNTIGAGNDWTKRGKLSPKGWAEKHGIKKNHVQGKTEL